ncbi:EI24 domain-containing protein [Streptosporangium sp. NBC_01755]|uniref:EI24 domain-containing protein n=1 Tax=unclassified Streptosporangium TaxID=2632669 RepID=UPI002DDADB44|nr:MULTISPECIES: EI24 domain-containing protein [unclassified Streptosporangium]WSA27114.1 EI24 domain-containing protein [Streptosporangium sp. NBC_01810]WSD01325.1 EI24 domain-containing protein [Streptosporangium sp. NBC_01755]
MGHFRSFMDGIGFFFQGLRWVARYPRWWLFGVIPALIAFVLYAVGLYLLGKNALDIAAWGTPFADGWGEAARTALRALVGLVLFGTGLVLSVVTFTAVTLILGDPFYEKLSEKVEETYGEVPTGYELPLWKSIPRSIRDSLVTLGWLLVFTIPLFFLGFVPVVGQTVVPVLGALVSGFFLTIELTALALERRGMVRKSRFGLLRANKAPVLGFGVLLFLLFLVPFVAVIAMPPAVAGAAIMVRTRLAPAVLSAERADGGPRIDRGI